MSFVFKPGQEDIIQRGVHSLKYSSDQVFEFDGEAGTGKSVVLMEILRRAGYRASEILPLAYTGSAAIVMRTKGFQNATTIHSGLFDLDVEYKYNDSATPVMNTNFNAPVLRTVFRPKESLPGIKVIAIDEGYMVPSNMKPIIEKFGIKVVVTGDRGQLPPIDAKPAYLYRDDIPHLTELIRQSENDGVVYIARRARRGLPINTGLYGNALVIEESDLTDEMILASKVVLCGTNKTREKYNSHIRHDLFNIHGTLPAYGERVICRKNNWNTEIDGIALANGLTGHVSEPVNMLTFDGKTFEMSFMPDLLNVSFENVRCNYEYLIGDVATRNKIKHDKYSMGELFEFAYSSTTHLAQGSEYSGGIYIEEYLGSIQNNLNYSGATRFKQWMIYVKPNRKFY